MPSGKPYRVLTEAQAQHFVQNGWVKIEGCFSRQAAADATRDVWTRLGMDPNNMATWTTEQNGMPTQNRFPIPQFAPKAWDALCDIVGDESLVVSRMWNDGFIVNLGSPEGAGKDIPVTEWHVDGQRWVNFLDTADQGLLLMPLYSDIRPGGGGTMIIPKALPILLNHLYEHPEGVMPGFVPVGAPHPGGPRKQLVRRTGLDANPKDYVEVTGNVGDMYILHPFMLHSRANNKNRDVRIVTNNNFPLKEPFNFNRPNPEDFSLVEKCTLRQLGRDQGLNGWKITGTREKFKNPYEGSKKGTKQERVDAERKRVGEGHNWKLFN